MINAILWKLRIGAPWRDLPERYGPWSTVHSRFRRWRLATGAPWRDLPERYGPWPSVYTRFRRWRLAGVWDRVFAALQRREDAAGRVDWEVQFVDGSVVRAHQHAAGAKGGTLRRRLWGAVRGASRPRYISRPRATASP